MLANPGTGIPLPELIHSGFSAPLMLTPIVHHYQLCHAIPDGHTVFEAGSAALKSLIFHIMDDNSRPVRVLDIGFGTGTLAETIKTNPATRHWEVDGIDGYYHNCCNKTLFEQGYYRHVWHGLAQHLPQEQLRDYDILCLLDVIEHLDLESAKWLLRTLLSTLNDQASLFISTPLWFYPQHQEQTSDLQEHRIGIPASSMMALQPVMYAVGMQLVGNFVYRKASLDFAEFFQPTANKDFSLEQGIKIATAVGMNLTPNVVFKLN